MISIARNFIASLDFPDGEPQSITKLLDECDRLYKVIDTQKETIHTLELANETMRRRVISLEQDRK